MSEESPEVIYEKWYPDVPPVMDSQELAELLSASDQVIRTWAREGVIPSHRAPGARKFKFLRHEIFEWLVETATTRTPMVQPPDPEQVASERAFDSRDGMRSSGTSRSSCLITDSRPAITFDLSGGVERSVRVEKEAKEWSDECNSSSYSR